MASVTLISKSGAEVIVDTTREYLDRVYNQGWMPKTGTVESNYELLLSGITNDVNLARHNYVRIADITERTTSGVADLFLKNFLGQWVGNEDVKKDDFRLSPNGQIIRRLADGVTRGIYDATEASAWALLSGLSGGGGGTLDPEYIRDTVAAFIQAGANVTATHNDAGDALTISVVPPALDLELVRDTVALMIRAGTNMSVLYDDAANALILSSTGSGGGSAGFIDGGTASATFSDTVIDGGLAAA